LPIANTMLPINFVAHSFDICSLSGIVIVSIIMTQMDTVILTNILTPELFWYYVRAAAVTMSLSLLIAPVFSAMYFRFTQIVSLEDEEGSKQLCYHSCPPKADRYSVLANG
jgi:hypothetical protein